MRLQLYLSCREKHINKDTANNALASKAFKAHQTSQTKVYLPVRKNAARRVRLKASCAMLFVVYIE